MFAPSPRPRLAPSRAGRTLASLAAALHLVSGGALAAPVETVLAPSGPWVVETIRRSHAPDERPAQDERPALVVGLHGYGIDQSQMGTLVNVRPNLPHVYVAVRGRHAAPEGGYGWFAVSVTNDRIAFDADELSRVVDEVADLLPRLAERHGADPARIHLVGYSQGGTLALHVALARPEAAASFAGFAGALLPLEANDPSSSVPRPVLIGHGTRDPLVSAADVEASAERLRERGRTVEIASFPVPHVVSRVGREAIARWIERHDPSPTKE